MPSPPIQRILFPTDFSACAEGAFRHAAIGMAIGIFLVKRINAALFYHIAYIFAFILGLKLLFDGVTAFI